MHYIYIYIYIYIYVYSVFPPVFLTSTYTLPERQSSQSDPVHIPCLEDNPHNLTKYESKGTSKNPNLPTV